MLVENIDYNSYCLFHSYFLAVEVYHYLLTTCKRFVEYQTSFLPT